LVCNEHRWIDEVTLSIHSANTSAESAEDVKSAEKTHSCLDSQMSEFMKRVSAGDLLDALF